MRHQSIRHPWGYVVVALAIITLVSLAGCSVTGELVIPNQSDPDGPPLLHYTGTPGGAAAVGVEYVRGQRQEPARPEVAEVDCTQHSHATAAAECERQKGEMARLRLVMGTEPAEQETGELAGYLRADAQMYAADRQFWGNIIGASISGGTSLISQAIASSTQRKRDAQMFETFRTFAEESGTATYTFDRVVTGGDLGLNQIGRDGNLAGNDIGQSTVTGGLIGRDSIPTEGDGVVGGQPVVTGGEAPSEISPSDPDNVQSGVELF